MRRRIGVEYTLDNYNDWPKWLKELAEQYKNRAVSNMLGDIELAASLGKKDGSTPWMGRPNHPPYDSFHGATRLYTARCASYQHNYDAAAKIAYEALKEVCDARDESSGVASGERN